MRLFVVGANGALGRQVVALGLARGHQVTALVRGAETMTPAPGMTVVEGSVGEQPGLVEAAVAGHGAVISAVGNHTWLRGGRTRTVMAAATANLVAAMRVQNVARIVIPLAWGAGVSRSAVSPPVLLITRLLMHRDFADLDIAEHTLADADLDWTVAYFGALTDTAATGRWTANEKLQTPTPLRISRADVADFLISAVEEDHYARQRVVLNAAREAR